MLGRKTGGRRPGSRNANRKDLAIIIESAISTEERMRLLAELSRGISIQVTDARGVNKVYVRPPEASKSENVNVVLIPGGPPERRKD